MKVIFENKYEFTEAQVNIPFMLENTPIGIVYDVTKDIFTIQIFDKYIGLEIRNNNADAIYLSTKEQISYEDFKKMQEKSKTDYKEGKCISCGCSIEQNLKVCGKCANEYKF
ncbi:MAG: hypothetical protein WC067_05445 [Candidatus Methanomethylophilaceae archaeon]